MGIIIFPWLLGAIIICIIALIAMINALIKKEAGAKAVLLGLLLSILIYAGIFIDYKTSESAYGLGTAFYFPFAMIYAPFFIAVVLTVGGPKTALARKVLYCSIIISGLLITIFYKYTLGLVDYLEIPKTY